MLDRINPYAQNMLNTGITINQFREDAVKRFKFLEIRGYRRLPEAEPTSSMGDEITYVGKYVGFVISFDFRDQCVDGLVVKVENGEIKRNWEGGYSSSIFGHLVKYAGYRGGAVKVAKKTDKREVTLQRMLDAVAELLENAGQSLLEDRPDSLPVLLKRQE